MVTHRLEAYATGMKPQLSVDSPLADWNGEILPLADVRVSVCDRSFLFGDAVYEVFRVYNGGPFLEDEHFQRLEESLAEIRLAIDVADLRARSARLLSAAKPTDAILYLQVTRGAGAGHLWRTHRFPPADTKPNSLIVLAEVSADPYGELRSQGAAVILEPDSRWKHCHIKSVNLLPNCMASEAAAAVGCYEAVLYDEQGWLTEGSHTSVFGVRGGQILTTPLSPQVLPGITRKLMIRLANEAGLNLVEKPVHRDHLLSNSAESLAELFLTGTTAEVMPVTQIYDRETGQRHPIGTGKPGAIAVKLQQAYRAAIDVKSEPLGASRG